MQLLQNLLSKIKNFFVAPYSRATIALMSACLFFVVFDSKLFFARLFNENAHVFKTLAEPFPVIFVLFVVFLLFAQVKITYRIFAILLFISAAIAGYFLLFMNIVLDQPMMVTIFATDADETTELVNLPMLLKMFSLGIIPVLFAVFIKFEKWSFKFKHVKQLIVYLCILTITPLLFNVRIYNKDVLKTLTAAYMPYNYIDATNRYFGKTRKSLQVVDHKVNVYDANDFFIEKGNEDLVVVVVVGESARRSNFSLNGYSRRTNPYLEKENNIVSYQTTTSCSRFTQYSVPCLMIRQTKAEFKFPMTETSIISVFKGLGFDAYWYDIQGAFSSNAMPIFQIASEAKEKIFRGNLKATLPSDSKLLDEHLLPFLDRALNEHKEDGGHGTFIVLHTAGSHYDYDDRYPDEFKKFQPICNHKSIDKCSKEEITNSYDNTILYTDYFLHKVIQRLKGRNAIMLYVSDHAESLGEDGVFLHGTDEHMSRPEQFEIPLIWWASDKFLENVQNKKRFENIKYNAIIKKGTSHDNVFYSLLDCTGISSSVIKKELSMCSKPSLFGKEIDTKKE